MQIVTGVFIYAPALRTLAPRLVRELLTRNDFIKQSFERWQSYYEAKFAAVLATRRPNFDVTASELAETVVSVRYITFQFVEVALPRNFFSGNPTPDR